MQAQEGFKREELAQMDGGRDLLGNIENFHREVGQLHSPCSSCSRLPGNFQRWLKRNYMD